MRLPYILACELTLNLSTSFAQSVKIVGIGSTSCGQYLAQSQNLDSEREFLSWAQGYMSGLLIRAPLGVDDTLDLLPPQYPLSKQLDLLKSYCFNNKNKDFSDAVEELYKKLRMSNT